MEHTSAVIGLGSSVGAAFDPTISLADSLKAFEQEWTAVAAVLNDTLAALEPGLAESFQRAFEVWQVHLLGGIQASNVTETLSAMKHCFAPDSGWKELADAIPNHQDDVTNVRQVFDDVIIPVLGDFVLNQAVPMLARLTAAAAVPDATAVHATPAPAAADAATAARVMRRQVVGLPRYPRTNEGEQIIHATHSLLGDLDRGDTTKAAERMFHLAGAIRHLQEGFIGARRNHSSLPLAHDEGDRVDVAIAGGVVIQLHNHWQSDPQLRPFIGEPREKFESMADQCRELCMAAEEPWRPSVARLCEEIRAIALREERTGEVGAEAVDSVGAIESAWMYLNDLDLTVDGFREGLALVREAGQAAEDEQRQRIVSLQRTLTEAHETPATLDFITKFVSSLRSFLRVTENIIRIHNEAFADEQLARYFGEEAGRVISHRGEIARLRDSIEEAMGHQQPRVSASVFDGVIQWIDGNQATFVAGLGSGKSEVRVGIGDGNVYLAGLRRHFEVDPEDCRHDVLQEACDRLAVTVHKVGRRGWDEEHDPAWEECEAQELRRGMSDPRLLSTEAAKHVSRVRTSMREEVRKRADVIALQQLIVAKLTELNTQGLIGMPGLPQLRAVYPYDKLSAVLDELEQRVSKVNPGEKVNPDTKPV